MTPDELTGFTIILACIGIAGWVVATWQWFRAGEAEFDKAVAEWERSVIERGYSDIMRQLGIRKPEQARDLLGRYVKR